MSISTPSAWLPEIKRRPSIISARASPTRDDQPDEQPDRAVVAALHRADDVLRQEDRDDRGRLRPGGEHDRDDHRRPVRPQEAEQTPERAAVRDVRNGHRCNLAAAPVVAPRGHDQAVGARRRRRAARPEVAAPRVPRALGAAARRRLLHARAAAAGRRGGGARARRGPRRAVRRRPRAGGRRRRQPERDRARRLPERVPRLLDLARVRRPRLRDGGGAAGGRDRASGRSRSTGCRRR